MIITPNQFDFDWFRGLGEQKRKRGNPMTRKRRRYWNLISAFDIETTRLPEIEQSIMYIWQWQFGDWCTVIGRTWQEFQDFSASIAGCLPEDTMLVVYVHNLSYEFQFLRGIYKFSKDEVFAIQPRKVLKCDMLEHLEFRCSYLHSNMSLDAYTNKMGAEHGKLSGEEFDYTKRRYPWTHLSDRELEYCINDVLGLVEALKIEMEHDGDNLYSIPLTSTGYVRRDAKKAMRKVSHTYVSGQLPNVEIYSMLREGFRGGNTHANRYYAGIVLHDLHSADRSSSYPDVLCNCKFPVSQFYYVGAISYEELQHLIVDRGKAVIMRVSMTNVRLSDPYWGAPYLSRDKCRKIRDGVYDNGRILSADYLETTITDIDLQILLSEYDFDDLAPFDVAYARYGKLPRPLIDTVIEYYVAKTSLKGVTGQELYYMKSKNKLNSIYGMMAQDPVKQSIDFVHDDFMIRQDSIAELLHEHNRKAFLAYQWGVWTTAWARLRLEEGIRLAGDRFVYCDTDSVKYFGDVDWSPYNRQRIKDSLTSGAHATDPAGNEHYMGVYEQEADMSEFATLGAKKYVYRETPDSELTITIAGVQKKSGGKELDRAGGIEAFKPGFIFRDAGGTESIYNDAPEVTSYTAEGHTIPITSNVVIKESTYTLGVTAEYSRLLEIAHKGIDLQYDLGYYGHDG